MFFSFKFKKSQSLPLNTIVIAILVIIVLVVIITFFVSNTAKTGDEINQNSASICSISNPAIKAMGYIHAEYSTSPDGKKCADSRYDELYSIPRAGDNVEICGKKVAPGAVCCATKVPNSWTCND
jgi:hypothetical protein